jgi:hypothetical protein
MKKETISFVEWWLLLVLSYFFGVFIGTMSVDKQDIYNKGVNDGKKQQLQQDEMLYKKIEKIDKNILWEK